MSNNKLYTTEQVIQVFEKYGNMSAINARNIIDLSESIEIPSDEEIEEEALKREYFELSFFNGAKMVISKIQGGNK
jgi:hypothetical protein